MSEQSWTHRRGLTVWQRCAIVTGAAALTVMFAGMWQEAEPSDRPVTATTDPAQAFHEPPRMPLSELDRIQR